MILVIDSATAACSVALIDGGKVVDERHEVVGRGHAERLVPMVADLLGKRRPAGILVDCGPGSFTGLRVGLAAAHGLAIGWQVPLLGYSSMALIAAMLGGSEEVTVALSGGHGELFVQAYWTDPLLAVGELQSLTPEAAALAFPARRVGGSGAETLVRARTRGEAIDMLPRASAAALLPPELCRLPAKPIYGRAPDAMPLQ